MWIDLKLKAMMEQKSLHCFRVQAGDGLWASFQLPSLQDLPDPSCWFSAGDSLVFSYPCTLPSGLENQRLPCSLVLPEPEKQPWCDSFLFNSTEHNPPANLPQFSVWNPAWAKRLWKVFNFLSLFLSPRLTKHREKKLTYTSKKF